MRRNLTRALSFLLSLMICLSVLLIPATAYKAPIINPCDSSYVVDDLEAMGYNPYDYKYDPSADFLQVIHFLEYGYSKNISGYYSLYLYLYNPGGRAIALEGSTLQMCYSTGTGDSKYVKYPLEVVSYSLDEGQKHILYKFEVKGIEAVRREIKDSSRTYKLASVEILYEGESKPVSRLLDDNSKKNRCRWTYTGYQQGFGSSSDGGTLQVQIDVLDTISIELHDASWMSDTSSLGEDYRWEVKSYYFNIPDSYIKTYGNIGDKNSGLVSVEGEYYKYGLNGLVVPDRQWYDKFSVARDGVDLNGVTKKNWPGFRILTKISSTPNTTTYYNALTYNMSVNTFHKSDFQLFRFNLLSIGSTPSISNDTLVALWNDSYRPILTDTSHMYMGQYTSNIGERIPFKISVTDGDLGGSIKTYASQNKWGFLNWLHRLLNEELYTDEDGYLNCMPLFEVEASDVSEAYKDDVQGKRLYLDYDGYTELQEFYNDMSHNNSVYVMRLGVEPYFESDVQLASNPEVTNLSEVGYYYEKVIHKDVDVFAFTFQNAKGEKQTVPVECDPVDNLGSVVEGNNKDDGNPNGYPTDPSAGKIVDDLIRDLIDWIKSLKGIVILIGSTIGIVTVLVLLVVFWRYLEPWFIRIGAVLGVAFRGLGRFFGALGRGLGAVFGGLFRLLFGGFKALWNIGFTVLFYFTGLDLRIRGGFDLGSGDTIVRDPDAGEKRERDRQRFKEEMNEAARKEERHRDELQDRAENRMQRREEELRKQERHGFELQSRANERELRNKEERRKQERHEFELQSRADERKLRNKEERRKQERHDDAREDRKLRLYEDKRKRERHDVYPANKKQGKKSDFIEKVPKTYDTDEFFQAALKRSYEEIE